MNARCTSVRAWQGDKAPRKTLGALIWKPQLHGETRLQRLQPLQPPAPRDLRRRVHNQHRRGFAGLLLGPQRNTLNRTAGCLSSAEYEAITATGAVRPREQTLCQACRQLELKS